MVTRAERDLVQEQLEDLHRRHLCIGDDQVVSFYPPDLEEARRGLFGVAGTNVDGTQWSVGDCGHRFPLHSISKVFTYAPVWAQAALTDAAVAASVRLRG